MRIVHECVVEVPGLFQALIDNDESTLKAQRDRSSRRRAADLLKNTLRNHMPKSIFMPVDRRDLLELLDYQDSIADTAQDIAGLLIERNMEVPADMAEPLLALVNRCTDASTHALKLIEELDELVEVGFRGRAAEQVEEMVAVLAEIEKRYR